MDTEPIKRADHDLTIRGLRALEADCSAIRNANLDVFDVWLRYDSNAKQLSVTAAGLEQGTVSIETAQAFGDAARLAISDYQDGLYMGSSRAQEHDPRDPICIQYTPDLFTRETFRCTECASRGYRPTRATPTLDHLPPRE